jgi:hypothetical protein
MDHHNVVSNRLSNFIIKFDTNKEILSDGLQGIFGPGEEPIDARVADKSREVSATDSQSITSRGHTEHDVNLLTRSGHEI